MTRDSTEWIEEDLLRMISEGEQKSIGLDYKACDSLQNTDGKKTEISKDVSAFSNSAGGVIIYGMKEIDHVATELDAGFDPGLITKEWLEDVIQGRIHPRIQGLHINPIQLTTRSHGKVAYAVTIPQSNTAHQAHDKRYYKRFNFKSEPMEDHEIRDVMSRLKFPLLAPTFSARFIDRKQQVHEYRLDVQIENNGPIAAHTWKIVLWIPLSLSFRVKGFDKQEVIELPSRIYGHQWFEQGRLENRVIFPGEDVPVAGIEFAYKIDTTRFDKNESREPFLRWKIYADNMPPRKGEIFLSSIPHPES
jgi:Putative DNA-binding domain